METDDLTDAKILYLGWTAKPGNDLAQGAIGFIYKVFPASTYAFKQNVARAGNIQLMWHGTTRICTYGDDPKKLYFCKDSKCSLCRILQWGYSLKKANPGGLLGKGIYSSPVSSKSSQFCKNTKSSKYQALILNRVVVGNTYKTTYALNNSTAPPTGYDSVSASGGGGLVNFDETCVYDESMIVPCMLYMYKAP
ncbi:hypothetical protein R3P38DRAFT_3217166 [Favolaschia claudopus]|uniref:PARP catalytic domain-containing protein n=1 Tax=Favolaschia claudopus TaxID=2862362 RepID=A0AAW0A5Y5_9AGAR